VVFLLVIPLHPFKNMGYYRVYERYIGYINTFPGAEIEHLRFTVDYAFANHMTLAVYFVLLLAGILIILRTLKKKSDKERAKG